MDGDKNTALFHAAFIALRLILRDSHSNQGTHQAAHSATHAKTSQSAHDRAGSDDRADTWDRERANARKKSQGSTHCTPNRYTSCSSFWRLCVLFSREVPRSLNVRHQDGNIVV